MLLISFPALGALGLVVGSTVLPIVPASRIVFPLNLTLPLVHTALVLMMVKLVITMPSALQTAFPALQPLAVWENWRLLFGCFAAEVVILSVLVLARPGRPRPAPGN